MDGDLMDLYDSNAVLLILCIEDPADRSYLHRKPLLHMQIGELISDINFQKKSCFNSMFNFRVKVLLLLHFSLIYIKIHWIILDSIFDVTPVCVWQMLGFSVLEEEQ